MDLFKDLRDSGILNVGNEEHTECLRFCFNEVLQTELDEVRDHWNLHNVRHQKNLEDPHGKPDFLYNNPEVWGARNVGHPVVRDMLDACRILVPSSTSIFGCSDEFAELGLEYLLATQRSLPRNILDALDLFRDLVIFLES